MAPAAAPAPAFPQIAPPTAPLAAPRAGPVEAGLDAAPSRASAAQASAIDCACGCASAEVLMSKAENAQMLGKSLFIDDSSPIRRFRGPALPSCLWKQLVLCPASDETGRLLLPRRNHRRGQRLVAA